MRRSLIPFEFFKFIKLKWKCILNYFLGEEENVYIIYFFLSCECVGVRIARTTYLFERLIRKMKYNKITKNIKQRYVVEYTLINKEFLCSFSFVPGCCSFFLSWGNSDR